MSALRKKPQPADEWVLVPRLSRTLKQCGGLKAAYAAVWEVSGVLGENRDEFVLESNDKHTFAALFCPTGGSGALTLLRDGAYDALTDAGLDPPYWAVAYERMNNGVVRDCPDGGATSVSVLVRGSTISVAWAGKL